MKPKIAHDGGYPSGPERHGFMRPEVLPVAECREPAYADTIPIADARPAHAGLRGITRDVTICRECLPCF